MNCHNTDLKQVWKCCCHINYNIDYVCISNNAGQPNGVHSSGRCSPEGEGIVDTANILPELDVQPSSETSFCTSPLPTETSAPIDQPVTDHEVSHELDHEAADSPRLGLLLGKDDSALSGQHLSITKDTCRLSPEGPSVTSAPLPPSCTEDTETLATGQQGESL